MISFNVDLTENFTSFKAMDNSFVFIESFDNETFTVRVGNAKESKYISTIHASTSKELNNKLNNLFN